MDQYASQNPNNTYSPLPSIAPQQLQHNSNSSSNNSNSNLPPHTLPPLQAHHAAAISMHPMYGQPLTAPHTPTNTTPNTPGANGNGHFHQMPAQSGPRGGYQPQGPAYQQPMQLYNNSPSMMSQSGAHPQPIAPAPGPPHNRLVPLRPMNTPAPLHPQQQQQQQQQMHQGLASPYGQQHTPNHDQETPTHVVGSQGRRGILPSAPGRPVVGATGTGAAKSTMIPAKDADGKFPCPHCTKTYLHAKHLKRHLLRHTGDRPYMCVLCRDTFSRSDILKRHFQKCSIRRGNPTGASHLSHAQAHLKKSHPGPHKSSGSGDGDMMRNMNGMNGMPTDPSLVPFGVLVDKQTPNMIQTLTENQSAQEHLSRSNSLKAMSAGDGRDRRTLTGPGPPGPNRPNYEQSYSNDIPSTMSSSMNPQLAAYSMPNGHNGPPFGQSYDYSAQSNNGPMHGQGSDDIAAMANGRSAMPVYGGASNGQQSNVDWSQMFQPAVQDPASRTGALRR